MTWLIKIKSSAHGLCCLPKRHNAFPSTLATYSGQQWEIMGMAAGAERYSNDCWLRDSEGYCKYKNI
jgi:hypothetical protein